MDLYLIFGLIAVGLVVLSLIFGTYTVLRMPCAIFFCSLIGIELGMYVVLRWGVAIAEGCCLRNGRRHGQVMRALESAQTYDEFRAAALELDRLEDRESWKSRPESRYYHHTFLRSLVTQLRDCRRRGNISGLMDVVHNCMHLGGKAGGGGGVAGIMNEALYSKTHVGTKRLIEQFIDETERALNFIAAYDPNQPTPDPAAGDSDDDTTAAPAAAADASVGDTIAMLDPAGSTVRFGSAAAPNCELSDFKRALNTTATTAGPPRELLALKTSFFRDARRAYGQTALCLSGGASLGSYHWGVVLALLESGMLPQVISGTSAGAVVAALTCTRTDDELRRTIDPVILNSHLDSFEESKFVQLKRLWQTGVMFDNEKWLAKLQWYANGLTFLEAYERTGRILNITATQQKSKTNVSPPMLLNYLTTPHVTIASAILASSAAPTLVHPVTLIVKVPRAAGDDPHQPPQFAEFQDGKTKWRDGSLEYDLPFAQLSELFGVSFFIVSQTNPHVVPFFFNARGQSGSPSFWRRASGGWRGGFFFSLLELLLKEEMKKNLKVLAALQLLPNVLGQDWSALFLQEFQGQITCVPNMKARDFLGLLSDPGSPARVEEFIRGGLLCAFRKFSMITPRMRIGRILDLHYADCLRQTRNAAEAERSNPTSTPRTAATAARAPATPTHYAVVPYSPAVATPALIPSVFAAKLNTNIYRPASRKRGLLTQSTLPPSIQSLSYASPVSAGAARSDSSHSFL